MKNPFLWVLLVFCALVAAYLVFLGVISISTGLQHTQEEGSWMPVLAGVCAFLRFSGFSFAWLVPWFRP